MANEEKTLDDYPALGTFVVRHGAFWHYVPETVVANGEEKVKLIEHNAFNGEAVTIYLQTDLDRAIKYGAVHDEETSAAMLNVSTNPEFMRGMPTPDEDYVPEEGEEEEVELADLEHSDLVDWLMSTGAFDGEKKPTADEVVAAVENDKALAQRVIDAEKEATGDNPRTTVIKGLDKVIESDEQ